VDGLYSTGGEEVQGVIQDICDWGPSGYRGAVRVCWENRNHTVERYRVGGDGEVDLVVVQSADGYSYYPDHLPSVGKYIHCKYFVAGSMLVLLGYFYFCFRLSHSQLDFHF
jgi:hypothetical protein